MTIISCLFQMSMLVRKPARHDLLTKAQPTDLSAYEPFDQDHVRNKYPKAEDSLVRRLGLAMTQRRKYLKYRERHHQKLSKGLDDAQETNSEYSELSDTIATDFKIGEVDTEDESAKSEVSQTSYAPTLLNGGDITIPPPPKASRGGEIFECPYCFFMITVRDSRAWYKHVFLDIQPYVCTVSECPTPHKLYSTQHEWIRHLRATHQADWDGSQRELTVTGTDASNCKVRRAVCPLCQSDFGIEKQFERHLARHLQEIALFVLPRSEPDSDASSDDNAANFEEDLESSGSEAPQITVVSAPPNKSQIQPASTESQGLQIPGQHPLQHMKEMETVQAEQYSFLHPLQQEQYLKMSEDERHRDSGYQNMTSHYLPVQQEENLKMSEDETHGQSNLDTNDYQIDPRSSRIGPRSTTPILTRDHILRLADSSQILIPKEKGRVPGPVIPFSCTLCEKKFDRVHNLRSHLRAHTDNRPFVCTVCGKTFARQHDLKRHEGLHSGEKKFVCRGELNPGGTWGCDRRFNRADALGRHFRSEAGRKCIKPLIDEEAQMREQIIHEQIAPNFQAGGKEPQDRISESIRQQALLTQFPALIHWDPAGTDYASAEGNQDAG